MVMLITNSSPFSLNSQKLSAIDALLLRMDFISVPVKTIPAVYVSIISYRKRAFLFCMLMVFCMGHKITQIYVFLNGTCFRKNNFDVKACNNIHILNLIHLF